ncbi:MAG: hypothetical protein AAGE52_19540 [Myxococcota bacterium]
MDVTLTNLSVYSLPSKQRVGCIVYDGAADMQLWPGPGPDTELLQHYGDTLQQALDNELKQVPGRKLEVPAVIRVHPGRLHCNFLAWVATRAPEPGSTREPAPKLDMIRDAVVAALEFAAQRNVVRIAFPALGGGPDELSKEDRLVIIVKAAHAYHEACIKEGRAPVVEEVLVCEASGPSFRKARDKVRGLAKAAEREVKKKAATKKKTTRKKKPAAKTRAAPRLTAEEASAARGSAEKYSMKTTYAAGDFFVHPKFGVGKVVDLPAPGQMMVSFEDGTERKLVHSRG